MRLLLNHYHPNITHDFNKCGYPCSDHASYYAYGFPSVEVNEADGADKKKTFNSNVHTSEDIYADGQVMSNYAKLAVTFLAEVAKGRISEDH